MRNSAVRTHLARKDDDEDTPPGVRPLQNGARVL